MNTIYIKDLHLEKKEHFYTGESCEIYKNYFNIYKIFDEPTHPFVHDKINRQFSLQKYRTVLDNSFILPHTFILDDDKNVAGYIQRNINNSKSLYDYDIRTIQSVKNLYLLLDKVCMILRTAHKNNIILGDFHFDNVLFNKKNEVYLIDFDNIKIEDIECFTISRLLAIFLSYYSIPYSDLLISPDSDKLSLLLSTMYLFLGDNYIDLEHEKIYDVSKYVPMIFEITKILRNIARNKKIENVPYLDEVYTKIKRPL